VSTIFPQELPSQIFKFYKAVWNL